MHCNIVPDNNVTGAGCSMRGLLNSRMSSTVVLGLLTHSGEWESHLASFSASTLHFPTFPKDGMVDHHQVLHLSRYPGTVQLRTT